MAFRCIGRKEFIAIMQFIIAEISLLDKNDFFAAFIFKSTFGIYTICAFLQALAIANYCVVNIYDKITYDRMLFEHLCVNVAIAYINLFLALGTWLYTSNISSTRLLARVHTIITYVGLMTLLYVTRARYMVRYTYKIWYYFNFDDVFDEDFNNFNVSLVLIQFILMLSSIVCAVEGYMVYARFAVYVEKRFSKQETPEAH